MKRLIIRLIKTKEWKKITKDQLTSLILTIIVIIIAAIIRTVGEVHVKSHIENQRIGISEISENEFCLKLSKDISGTVSYKQIIYMDCKGE